MGKKINHRAAQVRSRQAAAARQHKEEAKRRAWWDAHRRHVLLAVMAAVIVLLAAIAVNHWVTESALPDEIRDLTAIEDNWLVIDTNTKVSTRYHHPASFDIPEGYVTADFTKYSDGVSQDFFVEATDESAVVSSVYIDGVPELTAAEYIQRALDYREDALNENDSVTVGDAFDAVVAGKAAKCLYLRFSTDSGDYGCLLCAFDAPKNVCVTATISGAYTTPENVQSVETLLAEAETLLAGLTIVQ